MADACKFVGANKEKSILYDDLFKAHGGNAAMRAWSYVRTSDFTSDFGDWINNPAASQVALDKNGEPKITGGFFVNTVNATKLNVLNITEDLADLAQARINVIAKLKGIADRYKNSGKQVTVNKIEALKNQLTQADEDKVALFRFIQFAATQADTAYKELLNLEAQIRDSTRTPDERRGDLRKLSRLSEYIQSFELVEGVGEAVDGFEYDGNLFGTAQDSTLPRQWISSIVDKIASTKLKYNKLAKPLVADFLFRYNNNANLTREQLVTMLTTVHEDIDYATRWGSSLADSGDQVLALVNRAISEVRNSLHQESFNFKQTKLKPVLDALEKDAESRGVKADDHEKLYDFMLERDKDGKLTGRYRYPPLGSTKAQVDFYRMFDHEYRVSQLLLPDTHRRGQQLIPVLKSAGERAFQDVNGLGSAASATGKLIKDRFVKQSTDTDKGQVDKTFDENNKEFRFIPIHYTQKITESSKMKVGDISLNLASSLGVFRHMAENYHQMAGIVTELEATKTLVGTRKVSMKEGDKTVFNRATGQQASSEGKDSYAYKQLQDYLAMQVYGERQVDEGTFSFFGVEIDKAKLANSVAAATAFSQLGLNVYSALNNLTVGNYTNYMESAGGQFYSASDMLASEKDYAAAIPALLTDFSNRNPTSKLGVVMEELDIFQEESPTGELLKEKSMLRRADLGAVHFMTKAGEHSIQSKLFISMARSHREVDGKILSYSDWVVANNKRFDSASKAEFEKLPSVWSKLDAKDGLIETSLNRKELTKFSERVKGVYQRLHGNYAARDTPAMNRHGMGRLLGLFRKFLKPGWDRRWASDTFDGEYVGEGEDRKFVPFDRFDQRLGANIGGNYRIAYNFLKKIVSDYNTLGSSMMSEDWKNLPEWKKQAVIRTTTEAAAFAALALMVKALSSLVNDKEDPNWAITMGLYQMSRLQQEIAAFVNPVTAMDLLRSPAASMSMFQKVGRIVTQLVPGAYGMIYPESGVGRFKSGKNKGELKLKVYSTKIIPLYSQVIRVFDPKQELGWLNK